MYVNIIFKNNSKNFDMVRFFFTFESKIVKPNFSHSLRKFPTHFEFYSLSFRIPLLIHKKAALLAL